MRVLLVLLLLAAASAGAQVYKWTDSTGKTHYGDRPPEDAKKQELRITVPSYDGPVKVRDWGAVLRAKGSSATAGMITMYSTAWCGHCKRAKRYFARRNIPYREIDVEKSAEGRREYQQLGGDGVPLIIVGNKAMSGFDEGTLESMLASL